MSTKKVNKGKKDKILKDYAKLRSKFGKTLSMSDFIDNSSHTKDMIKHHWGSLGNLDSVARVTYPDSFHDVTISSILSKKRVKSMNSTIKSNSHFFITAAITGCEVHDGFRAAIANWEKATNGKLLIQVSSDPAHNLDRSALGTIDKKLVNDTIILEDTELNPNIFLSTIKMSAKQIDPITGLSRLGQRNGSFIYASPKQRMSLVPTSNGKTPHVLMTTGAITKPDYSSPNFMSNRTAYIAENDHVLGGLIVELDSDDKFHFRQVQADDSGDFIDLGVKYCADGSMINVNAEAVVLGDWHNGETDPVVKKCWKELCDTVKPKYLVVHDVFNGASISPHEEQDIVRRTSNISSGLTLRDELESLSKDIDELSTWSTDELVIVKSNHDEWIDKYIKKAKYASDPVNHGVALKIADAVVNHGHDPLKWSVMNHNSNLIKNPNKIKWLRLDEDFKVAGVQLGAHGDKGANGAKGNLISMEAAYGNSITGHSHSPAILRGAWSVGTSTHLRLGYNAGPSSWLNSSCILYSNSSRQLINVIDGKWRL